MKKHAACPKCSQVFQLATSGTIRGAGVLGAALLGVRINPWVGVGLAIISILWGDKIQHMLQAWCPECKVALEIIGTVYG
jgi:hypothetical protein